MYSCRLDKSLRQVFLGGAKCRYGQRSFSAEAGRSGLWLVYNDVIKGEVRAAREWVLGLRPTTTASFAFRDEGSTQGREGACPPMRNEGVPPAYLGAYKARRFDPTWPIT